jgi:hypothetical protein
VKACIACGVFLIVLGVYALSSPGRIDIVARLRALDASFPGFLSSQTVAFTAFREASRVKPNPERKPARRLWLGAINQRD